MELMGGQNPVNGATIDITSTLSQIHFTSETVDAFTAEHLSEVTVNGAAAVVGVNLSVVDDGTGVGSIVTAVPEPATLVLLGLGSLVTVRRRK